MNLIIKLIALSWLIAAPFWYYTGQYQKSQVESFKESLIKVCQEDSNQNRPYESSNIMDRILKFHSAMNNTKLGTPEYIRPVFVELQARTWFSSRYKNFGYFQSAILPGKGEIFNNNELLTNKKDTNIPSSFLRRIEKDRAKEFFRLINGKTSSYINPELILDIPSCIFLSPTYYVYDTNQIKKMSDEARIKIASDSIKYEEYKDNLFKYRDTNKYLGYYILVSAIFAAALFTLSKLNFKKKINDVKEWKDQREHDKLRAEVEAEIRREQEKEKIRKEILDELKNKE